MAGEGVRDAPVPDVAELTRVIALDGPAGSGKSTVARRTAQALGWRFVDTGATYRAVTLHVLRAGVPLEDLDAVADAAQRARVVMDVDPWSTRVELDGEDVSTEIRGAAVTAAVSAVSAVPAVRERLVQLQRQLMGTSGAVVEGRDIATVVAPRAGLKVYLDAREEVRAQRRAGDAVHGLAQELSRHAAGDEARHGAHETTQERRAPAAAATSVAQGAHRGSQGIVGAVQEDLRRRDALDSQTNRLEVSEGAIHLDTSDLALDEVVDAVVELARTAGLVPAGKEEP